MSEEQHKEVKLVATWLLSTTIIVFGAVTALIAIWGRPIGASMAQILRAGLPIWGITALAVLVAFGGYFVYTRRKV